MGDVTKQMTREEWKALLLEQRKKMPADPALELEAEVVHHMLQLQHSMHQRQLADQYRIATGIIDELEKELRWLRGVFYAIVALGSGGLSTFIVMTIARWLA